MLHQFALPGGRSAFINLDAVSSAVSNEEGFTEVTMMNGFSFTVSSEAFAKAVSSQDEPLESIKAQICRLIEAMDRMTVHFPTSIRMHM